MSLNKVNIHNLSAISPCTVRDKVPLTASSSKTLSKTSRTIINICAVINNNVSQDLRIHYFR